MTDLSIAERTENFREIFISCDSNHDGSLTLFELNRALTKLGYRLTNSDVAIIFSEIDSDESGTISFREFLTLLDKKKESKQAEDELLGAFKVFDQDGNGYVSADELRDTLIKHGENISCDEAEDIVKTADLNGDGRINYEEFVLMLLGEKAIDLTKFIK